MKFKTTAIAMAVAGSVAAPVAVQAGADELYASARVGIWNVDTNDQSQWDVRSFSSRFGAKGETDLGNGMSGFGRYEWDVDFNNDLGEDDISVRHRYVGLKGGFGSVTVGQTYHTFYNFAVGPTDIPWWHSGYAMVNYRSRTDNAITYAGGTGAFNFGASLYMTPDAEEEDIDQIEVGASFGIGDITIGGAWQSTADDTAQGSAGNDEDIIGLVVSGINFGPVSLGVGVQAQDNDDSFLIHVDIASFYIHLEALSVDATDQDRTSATLGYTLGLGRKTTMYFEANAIDNDTGNSDDDRTALMAVLKYDII
jgi:predicted porin